MGVRTGSKRPTSAETKSEIVLFCQCHGSGELDAKGDEWMHVEPDRGAGWMQTGRDPGVGGGGGGPGLFHADKDLQWREERDAGACDQRGEIFRLG